jgi:hypothetical protein
MSQENVVDNDGRGRSLLVWAGAAILAIVAFMALSAALDKPGDGNDPFLAEVGNLGAIVAMAALLAIAATGAVRALRR